MAVGVSTLPMALVEAPAVRCYLRIGWKLGSWHDVAWMQRLLSTADEPPAEPR